MRLFGFFRPRGDMTTPGPHVIAGRVAPIANVGTSHATACPRTFPEADRSVTVDIPGALEPDQFPSADMDSPLSVSAIPPTGGQIAPCPPVPHNVLPLRPEARGAAQRARNVRATR
jgi:hypothetical protein